jgi:nucleotide-binding universal stress UspA family protein
MKNILLLVHDDPGQESRLQAALDLSRALDGHLTCLAVTVMPFVSGEFYDASIQTMLVADALDRQAAIRKELEARLAGEGVSWNWIDVTGGLGSALNDAAKMADIVVVSRKLDSEASADLRAVAGQVVVGSGRLVVAVPEQARGFDVAGLAMVAWDGSDEAMDAVRDSVPLLKLARTVTIVEIKDGTVATPAEEAAAYLSRHGIHPVVVRRRPGIDPVGEVLIAEARGEHAAYVVMGGFGHGRLAEALIGGVSRDMLGESPVPTVMAH